MTLSSVLCGADTWVDVAEWAADNEDWLKKYLVLKNGAPSHDTFGRVFRLLDAAVFEQCFRNWIVDIAGVAKGVIALDGKTLCGSRDGKNTALHMVSAFATESGLCLGQEGTRGKGNEIMGIKALLETLSLKDCIVTIDAIGCQTEIAEKIVERGGDYLLAVKENQGNLFEAIDEFFDEGQTRGFGNTQVSCFETLKKDHGRIETRRYVWIDRRAIGTQQLEKSGWRGPGGAPAGDQRQGLYRAHALHRLQRHCFGPGAGQCCARPLGNRKSPALGA